MRRFVLAVSFAVFAVTAFAADEKPSLPSWFPQPAGLFGVKDLHQYAYADFDVSIDGKTTLPRNEGGDAVATGRLWRFDLDDPKDNAWTVVANDLLKQGFRFVHGDMSSVSASSTLQKGEGDHAIYVSFWQCCDSAAIIQPAPNPFHVTLKAPSATPEVFGDQDDIPYITPVAGSELVSGKTETDDTWSQPGCSDTQEMGTSDTTREYNAPAGMSDFALIETYEKAFRAAGWDPVCRTSHHEMDARYTKNGRDIGVYIASADWQPGYSIEVVDTGAGLRSQLKTNCKAALYGVNFDFDKATLRADADPALNQLLGVLRDEPKMSVEIGGHTDNVGKPDYNMKLSDARAAAVRQWLIAHGIAANRLTSHGYGDTVPLVPNSSDEDRARNRRVEIKRADCG